MKFFKKTSVAILLTALLVALCCVWGYSRAYEASHSDPDSVVQSQRAGESGLNYFLNWIDDGAGLFSMETTDTLARNNLDLNNTYGCLLALKTVNYLNGQDIASYSKDLFQQVDLGRKDMLLVIESSSQAWYLVYGGGLRTYAENNDALAALLKDNLDTDFFQGESDAGILSLFDDLEHWCAETLPVLDDTPEPGNPFLQNDNKVQILSLGDVLLGILFTLLVNIWWIILLLVVLNLIDRHRFREYITKHPPGSLSNPPVFFRPLLFWHGQGSSWYRRMLYLVTEAPYEDDDDFDEFDDDVRPTRASRSSSAPAPSRAPSFDLDDDADDTSSASSGASTRRTPGSNKVVNIHTTAQMQVVLVKPDRFDNVSDIAEHLRSKHAVVLNLEATNKDVARRLVDFLSGCAYALDGKIKKIAISTYIITPYNVDIVGDLIDKLENNGLYL